MSRILRRAWPAITVVGMTALGLVAVRYDWLDKDGVSVIIAGGSLLAAVAAWSAADTVTRIERDRWQAEFEPQIDFMMHRPGYGTRKATLHVVYTGPALHEGIDVQISVVDDGRYRKPHVTHGLTQAQIDAQVWGPYRLEPGVDDATPDGRRVPQFRMQLGQSRDFWLLETDAPPGYPSGQQDWWMQYSEEPIRIRVECSKGAQKWAYIRDVAQWCPPGWNNPPAEQ